MKKILIVDDELELVNVMIYHFKSNGWEALGALDGVSALAQVEEFKPDVILSDITMPEMTGLDFLAELADKKNNVPVIFLTGYSDLQKIKMAWCLGAFDLLEKPVAVSSLLQVAENALIHGTEYVKSARLRGLKLQKKS